MLKRVFGRKLSRARPAREALFSALARNLILNGKIETTLAKAKAVQPNLEKLVTMAKKGGLAGRRRITSYLDNQLDALEAFYKKIVPSFSAKNSGFTRIISLPSRVGDNARMARLEWTEKTVEEKKESKSEVKKTALLSHQKAKVQSKTKKTK